jgi:C4-dicarboxylate transporter DctM subunit
MAGLVMCIYAYIYAKRHNLPKSEQFSSKTALIATKNAFWALLMPFIILGGIYLGVFTPTESAAVAVLYGFIVSVLIYRELDLKKLIAVMLDSTKSTANILLIIAAATIFSWVLSADNIPALLTNFMTSYIHGKVGFLICLNVLLLILGMLMDLAPIVLIVGPLVYPIAIKFGVDPVQLGCIMIFNLSVGQATPPFGNCLFAATSVTGQNIVTLSKHCLPFITILFICVLLTTFIPAISLGLVWMMK